MKLSDLKKSGHWPTLLALAWIFGLPNYEATLLLGLVLVFVVVSGSLGMANGAVFQLLPQRFRRDVGSAHFKANKYEHRNDSSGCGV